MIKTYYTRILKSNKNLHLPLPVPVYRQVEADRDRVGYVEKVNISNNKGNYENINE